MRTTRLLHSMLAKLLAGTAALLAILLISGHARPGHVRPGHDFRPDVARPNRPNVVLIFMDDLGYGDLSCYGALGYRTPNLDRLAAEGTRFTNFLVAQPVCSASRAALLTGCYPNRLGISGALNPTALVGLHPEEETIAELLKEQGYRTGIFGKWHLGHRQPFLPLQQGFDEYLGIPYSNDMWPQHPNQANLKFPPLPLIEGNQPVKTLASLTDQDSLTTALTERAVSFVRRNRRNPFFLYLPFPMPHVPLAVSGKHRNSSGAGLYADVITEVDWAVGQILASLKQTGVEKNTLVIFTSDNGPWLAYGEHAGSSGGLREGKQTTFEGGNRVPCIVRWPGEVPAGQVSNQLLSTLDVLPTVARLCGARLPRRPIDGIDVQAAWRGTATESPRQTFLYYFRENNLEAVRKGDWKLVLAHPGVSYEAGKPGRDGKPGQTPGNHAFEGALYDLRHDPGERYDRQAMHPDVVSDLQQLAEQARADLGDNLQQRPGSNRRAPGTVAKAD
ncbi:arylsulfatase [Fibrisoma montanum]|uniref:Arylsulfatase n=2 Tax=Fibrisoma montanum TaxID=2305895 RepID=A0A418MC62_9BACT|nr:arylsulfatase [Fibrisoma montanum]